jgi:hypothetical protein
LTFSGPGNARSEVSTPNKATKPKKKASKRPCNAKRGKRAKAKARGCKAAKRAKRTARRRTVKTGGRAGA